MWREINGKRVSCLFNQGISFNDVYVNKDPVILDFSEAVKQLEKNPYNCEIDLPIKNQALLFVLKDGNIYKVNVLVQTKHLDLETEDFGSFLASIGAMCGELSFRTKDLYEIGTITYSAGMMFGKLPELKKVFLKEHKLIRDYNNEDFK